MKHLLLLLLLLPALGGVAVAQSSMVVRGVVVSDEDKLPVVGATVMAKGATSVATMTDVNGAFTLTVPAGVSTLLVSFVGLETAEVAVPTTLSAEPLRVVLRVGAAEIDEVVVTGMQRIDKRMFTGATDRLKADDVKLDGMLDASRSLEGRSAGVSVQNVSGTFGTAPKIRVRGATSIYGSSSPLWVVDNVVVDPIVEVDASSLSSGDAETLISSAIAGLNTDDIESFQILKDGSATSIYGARAMAGVIVITTKRGRAGASSISYSGEYTYRFKPRYSELNMMNSQQQMDVYREMQMKGWLNYADTYRSMSSGVFGKMYQLMNTYDPTTGSFALPNTQEAQLAYLQQAELRNTEWFDLLFDNTVQRSHSVSLSTGTDKATVYASIGVLQDPGWSKQSSVDRYTATLNATYKLLDNLSATLTSNASYREQRAPGTLSQTTDPYYGGVRRDFDINPFSYALNSSRMLDPDEFYTNNYAPFNIFHELENNYIDNHVTDLKFQGELRFSPLPSLTLTAVGAIKYGLTSQERHVMDASNQAEAYRAMPDAVVRDNNPYLYTDPDIPYVLPISILPEGGIYARADNRMSAYDLQGRAEWKKVIDHDHFTNLMLGAELNSTDRHASSFNGWGMQYSQGETPFYIYQFFKQSVERGSTYYGMGNSHGRSVAFYANGTYSYKGRYTLNGTTRYEGTNKLGKSRAARWLPTWNVSGAWNAHEENFWSVVPAVALSHFTLRASYSLTADRGPAFLTNSLMVLSNYTPYRPFTSIQESGIRIVDLENSELTYEKKHELNIGADMGFVNNRINLNIDVYTRNNYDLIGLVKTQGVGGSVSKLANVASMKSGGFELTLSTKNIETKNFKWRTDFIFSNSYTKVTSFDSWAQVMDLITGDGFTTVGYPVRGLFSIPFAGLNADGLPSFYTNAERTETTVSDINFQQYDNLDFLVYEGPTDPTTTGSLGNIFSYRNLRLNLFLTYSFGNKIRLDPAFSSSYNDLTTMPREFYNRWVMAGDENITSVPVIASRRQLSEDYLLPTAYNAYNYSDIRTASGDFIRLKEVSLTYDFPKEMVSKIKLSTLSLKVQGTNLLLLYADKKLNGQDPEFVQSGGVAMPVARQITFTLRVGM
jgi:TonB-linked SusC/RagA family outer membrane protein